MFVCWQDDFDDQFPAKLLGQGSYGTVTSGAWKHFGPGTAHPEPLVAIKRPVQVGFMTQCSLPLPP